MTTFFQILNSEEFVGATVLIDGQPYPIARDHSNYDEVVDMLLSGEEPNEDVLRGLLKPIESISNELIRLSERVTLQGNALYFDGDPINSALSEHIIRVFIEDKDTRTSGYQNFVLFLEKLMTNPSAASRDHLFDFAAHHKLTITDEGDLLLYKSTKHDGKATHAGYGIVTTPDGKSTIYKNDYLPNGLDYIVEIPRAMVDEDRHAACSVGLHVGAFSYASTYSYKLWNVLVNPRDVVSVPHDAGSAKIRVSRYQVIGENEGKLQHEGHSIDLKTDTLPGAPAEVVNEFVEQIEDEIDLTEDDQIIQVTILNSNFGSKAAPVAKDGSRVAEYEALITSLIKADPNVNLKRYKSKRITAARRGEFAQAAENLGFKL